MNLQQVAQPRSFANGFGRRRGEREMGSRQDNKLQSGKSNPSRLPNAGENLIFFFVSCWFFILTVIFAGVFTGSKGAGYEGPSRDRLVYLTTCLIGHHVEVQVKNGSVFSGIFHATNADKDFGMIQVISQISFVSTL